MSLYWRDLARLYPRAKVLLTVRDPARLISHDHCVVIRAVNEPS